MEWEEIIGQALAMSLTFGAIVLFQRPANKPALTTCTGGAHLFMPSFYAYIGYPCLFIGFACCLIPFLDDEVWLWIMSLVMLALFGGLGLLCILYHRNHSLKFDDYGLTVTDWRGRRTEMSYREIDRVKPHPLSGNVRIYSADRFVSVSPYLRGYVSFRAHMAGWGYDVAGRGY